MLGCKCPVVSRLAVVLLVVGLLTFDAMVPPAQADTFTVAGFTFDDTLGPTNVVPVPPSNLGDYQGFAFSAQFIPVSLEGNDFDIDKTVGIQLIGSEPGQNNGGTSIPLGDNFFRGGLELNWGGAAGVTNNPGDDFVVYENGAPNGPEAYMIAVRETGSSTFTDFRYEFADDVVRVLPSAGTDIAQVLSTGFDLSDFGLADGATIDAIIASNMLPADRVDDIIGEGTVIVGGGSGFSPLTGPQGNGGTYNSSGFDPDLTYIGVIVEPPSNDPGDFDLDGDVDGDDFLAWQRGESPNALDAGDLAEWETNYGPASLATAAVPEPTSGLMSLAAALLAALLGKRRLAPARVANRKR